MAFVDDKTEQYFYSLTTFLILHRTMLRWNVSFMSFVIAFDWNLLSLLLPVFNADHQVILSWNIDEPLLLSVDELQLSSLTDAVISNIPRFRCATWKTQEKFSLFLFACNSFLPILRLPYYKIHNRKRLYFSYLIVIYCNLKAKQKARDVATNCKSRRTTLFVQ